MIRRKLSAAVLRLNERTDRIAVFATVVYVLWKLVESRVTSKLNLSEFIDYLLTALDLVTFTLLVAYGVIRFTFKSPNRRWLLVLSDEECRLLKQWITSGKDSKLLDSSLCKVKFVEAADLDELTTLNYEAFRDTPYEMSLDQFRARNAEFIFKNAKCFLLFIDPIGGKKIIGYSCLVPLNELGTQLYLEGSVSDGTLRKELIAGSDEQPKSILLFAIHLCSEFSLAKKGASKMYSLYFWSCVRHHLRALCAELIDSDAGIDVYAQTHESSLRRRLKSKMGFTEAKAISKDGFEIMHSRICASNCTG